LLISTGMIAMSLLVQSDASPTTNAPVEACSATYVSLSALPGSARHYCLDVEDDGSTVIEGFYPDAALTTPVCDRPAQYAAWNCAAIPGVMDILAPDELTPGDSWDWRGDRHTVLEEVCVMLGGQMRCLLPISVYSGDTPKNMFFFEAGRGLTMFHVYFEVPHEALPGEAQNRIVAETFIAIDRGLFTQVSWTD